MSKKNTEIKKTFVFEGLKEQYQRGLSNDCVESIKEFRTMLDELRPDKRTHYFMLDESFYNDVYKFIREKLKEFGFINGDVEHNNSSPDISFYCELYKAVNCYSSSPFYEDVSEKEVNRHDESAYVRCEVLKMEIDNFLNYIKI